MGARTGSIVRTIVAAVALSFATAEAQWNPDGVPVCTASNHQFDPIAVPDGSGGVIIAWVDERGPLDNIYVQRLNSAGIPQWSTNGVLVTSIFFDQINPAAVPDGAGGVIVAWEEERSAGQHDVYAQRISSAGARLWGGAGVVVSAAIGYQSQPVMISDGRNNVVGITPGVIIAWQDNRGAIGTDDVYAQSVTGAGAVRWTANGVPVCTATGFQGDLTMVTDGTGSPFLAKGAIIAWADARDGDRDIYAQRINSSGVAQWDANGVGVCLAGGHQLSPVATFIGGGNAVIAWSDQRGGSNDIYGQRVGPSGGWVADGVAVCQANGEQTAVAMIGDGAGGVFLAWADSRSGSQEDIFAQRLTGTGVSLWVTDGVPLCTAGDSQRSPKMVNDAADGAIVAWVDTRGETFPAEVPQLYVQRVSRDGSPSWASDGIPVCPTCSDMGQFVQQTRAGYSIVGDNNGSAILAWRDGRSEEGNYNIYANRLSGGVVGVEEVSATRFRLLAPYPNPTQAAAAIAFELPAPAQVFARIFDVEGRLIRVLASGEELGTGLHYLRWDGRDTRQRRIPSAIYFLEVRAGNSLEVSKILLAP